VNNWGPRDNGWRIKQTRGLIRTAYKCVYWMMRLLTRPFCIDWKGFESREDGCSRGMMERVQETSSTIRLLPKPRELLPPKTVPTGPSRISSGTEIWLPSLLLVHLMKTGSALIASISGVSSPPALRLLVFGACRLSSLLMVSALRRGEG